MNPCLRDSFYIPNTQDRACCGEGIQLLWGVANKGSYGNYPRDKAQLLILDMKRLRPE